MTPSALPAPVTAARLDAPPQNDVTAPVPAAEPAPAAPSPGDLLNDEQAAQVIGVALVTLQAGLRPGRPGFKFGIPVHSRTPTGARLFTRADVERAADAYRAFRHQLKPKAKHTAELTPAARRARDAERTALALATTKVTQCPNGMEIYQREKEARRTKRTREAEASEPAPRTRESMSVEERRDLDRDERMLEERFENLAARYRLSGVDDETPAARRRLYLERRRRKMKLVAREHALSIMAERRDLFTAGDEGDEADGDDDASIMPESIDNDALPPSQ